MPNTISEKLYPQLPIEDDNAGKIYPKLPIESDRLNDNDEANQNIYWAINYQKDSLPEKRKLVCLVLNEERLSIKKVNHEEFEKHINFKDGQVYLNKNLIQLVLYVKKNKQNQCFEEITKILKISGDLENKKTIHDIREHFNKTWSIIRGFISYKDMKRSFDEKTGEYIQNSVMDLDKTFLNIEAKYNEYKKNYTESPEYTDTLDEMKKIIDKMEAINVKNKTDFDHLMTGTVDSVMISFKDLVKNFDDNCEKIELITTNIDSKIKLEQLEKSVMILKESCESILSPETVATEAIFEKKKDIKNNIDLLLFSIDSLKGQDNISSAIEGLTKKLESLQEKYVNLKISIKKPITNKINTHYEQYQKLNKILEEDIQPILENIKNHAVKTSKPKEIILIKILTYFEDLKGKIIASNLLNEIKDIIETVKDFIKSNIRELTIARGFFSNSGKSANLVQNLGLQLDKLAEIIVASENNVSHDLKK